MFRFLFKWSLQITGTGIVGYNLLGPQKQEDVKGAFKSITNSSRASMILFRSVYDYYSELSGIEYNSQDYHKKRSQVCHPLHVDPHACCQQNFRLEQSQQRYLSQAGTVSGQPGSGHAVGVYLSAQSAARFRTFCLLRRN